MEREDGMVSFRISSGERESLRRLAESKKISLSEFLRVLVRESLGQDVGKRSTPRRPKILTTPEKRLSLNFYSKLLYISNTTVHIAQAVDDLIEKYSESKLLEVLEELRCLNQHIELYFAWGAE